MYVCDMYVCDMYVCVVCDHVRVPTFLCMQHMWANIKKHISGIIPFS